MVALKIIVCAILSYLAGGIQTSILISKGMHDDIRSHGSGNAGSTNMVRVYGLKAGLLTFVCDFGKAFLAVGIGCLFNLFIKSSAMLNDLTVYACGLTVVLGHNYPIFFDFKGGKGVATSFAVVWAVFGLYKGIWIIPILTTVLGIGMLAVTGIVSVGSITGAATEFISSVIIFSQIDRFDVGACVLAFILFALLCLRHTKNIMRIMKGEEKKLSLKHKNKQVKTDNNSDLSQHTQN